MLSTAFWMQDAHRATTEAVGNALDSQPRQRNYCPSLFPAQWPLGRILGTTRRWLISGRFFTYKFGAHPVPVNASPDPAFFSYYIRSPNANPQSGLSSNRISSAWTYGSDLAGCSAAF